TGNQTERLRTVAITSEFFKTLGVPFTAGREFSSDETRAGGPGAVILTHALWKLAFDGDGGIVGRTIVLGKTPRLVLGILPADFWFPQSVDAFVPLRPSSSGEDTGANSVMIGRLKSGVSIREATAETAALGEPFRRESSLPYPLD